MRTAPLAALLATAIALLALAAGALPPAEWWRLLTLQPPQDALGVELFWQLRLPRILLASSSGALLALAGVTVQAQFRNPLAEPGLIGVSGGAALAAALALSWGWPQAGVSALAFAGGLAALFAARALSAGQGDARLILAGVAVNALCTSALTLLISTLPDGSLRTITFWLMGSFASAGWPAALTLTLAILPLAALLWREWPFLDALRLGPRTAFHIGFDVERRQWWPLALTACATALVVCGAGMVGFVGLMAPHLARLLVGAHLRRLLLVAPLLGAVLTLAADLVARQLSAPAELPVGVITSLAGAPFFLWLLGRAARRPHA